MKDKSFEESITELESIVNGLESGEKSLEESMTAFEEGIKLSEHCSKILDDAEKKIVQLIQKNDKISEEEISL